MVRVKKEDSSVLHSQKSLENSIERIEQLLVAARRVAAEMERLGSGPIVISNQPSFQCALADLSRWGKACEDSFTARLIEMGHFSAANDKPRSALPKKQPAPQKKGKKRISRK